MMILTYLIARFSIIDLNRFHLLPLNALKIFCHSLKTLKIMETELT